MTDTPTPAPAPMTARLRELLEEATEGEYSPQKMVALQMFMGFNAPTILRLLEAGDEVSDDMLAAFNASVEASLPYVRMKYDNDTLRRAIAATLRAAREVKP